MKCKYCNGEIKDGSQFCPNCGNLVNQNVNMTNNEVQQNVNSTGMNQNYTNPNQGYDYSNNTEKANIGLAIISWLIPIVGLIMFITKKDKEPKTAKVCGICALISFILNILIIVVTFFASFIFVGNTIDAVKEKSDSIIESIENDDFIIEESETDTTTDNETVNDNSVTTGNPSSDWKKYQVTINNQVISLPTTYATLNSASGFDMKSAASKSYLEDGYYTLVNMYKNDKLALYTEILNDTGVDKLYTECKITRISQTEYQVSQGADAVIFPGGLKAGDAITEEQIISLFGTPDDTYEYSSTGYESKSYEYFEDTDYTTTNKLEITVVNGIIDEIELDHRNY